VAPKPEVEAERSGATENLLAVARVRIALAMSLTSTAKRETQAA
jgi:hypothetical protein